MILSPTQKAALKALAEHSGEGAIDKQGCLLAAGVRLGEYSGGHLVSAYSPVTWSRLISAGLVEPAGENRLKISLSGLAELAPARSAASATARPS